MPFAALTGYYDMIKEKERIYEMRKERTDDCDTELFRNMNTIKIGSEVKLKYFDDDRYIVMCGTVEKLDTVYKTLTVNGIKIFFDDIYEAEILK